LGGTQEVKAFVKGDDYIMVVTVGRQFPAKISYQLYLKLSPSEEGTEFIFAFLTVDHDNNNMSHTFDSNEVAKIVPKLYRKRNLAVLLDAAERLVRACNRDAFYMVTFLPHLCEKQLHKYDLLCGVFKKCGYDVTHSLPIPGKHMWRMTRPEPILEGEDGS
jgi:hypothetical protein